MAYGFIRALAGRGHTLHVAAQRVALRDEPPPNVHLHVFGDQGSSEPLARLAYMARMRRLFLRLRRTTRFDLVHQLNPVDAGLSLALADVDLPMVLGPYVPAWPSSGTAGETAAQRLRQKLNGAVRAAEQRRATTVLLSTPAAAAKLQASARNNVRVREVGYGIDAQVWSPGENATERQDVLFLANLERRKGILVLLEAFAGLERELPASRLLVAGDGQEADGVRRILERSPGLRRVVIMGRVRREEVPRVMQSCTVYCLPSLGEPFGMTALEAMACGKPLVVTDAGGLRYLVDDRGGRRVPPSDPGALAAALREVLTAPDLQRRMGCYNRQLIEQRYTWERVAERLEDAYREAIAARAP